MSETERNRIDKLYQELPGEVFEGTEADAQNSGIIASLLSKAVPERDLKVGLQNKRLLYLSIKKQVQGKKRVKVSEKRRHISRKEKKKLNILKCPRDGWNYEELEPLRKLWREHMHDVLNTTEFSTPNKSECVNLNRLMSKADFHGAEMEVTKSRNPTLIGHRGTCVIDSRDTFGIVGKDNKYRTIPKESCVFNIILGQTNIIIYGKFLLTRPAERCVKKIKQFMVPSL